MKSLWLDSRHSDSRPDLETAGVETAGFKTAAFEPDASYDAIVVGAGLTGLTTALLLSRAGLNVRVLEARSIGAVTTGHTTAKLSLLQGTVLSGIRHHFSQKIVQAYVQGNLEGQAWLLRYLEEHDVAVQRRDAYTYATSDHGLTLLGRESLAGRDAGLDITLVERDIGLPYATRAALLLPDQAQFHPMEVLGALAADLHSRGVGIVEGTRVRDISVGTPATVLTDKGSNLAQHVILATGAPILDRGMYFAKIEPTRSYVAAYRVPAAAGVLPQGMYLSVEQPARSLRTVPLGNEELLLVGGNGHPVGDPLSEQGQIDDLDAWTGQHFPGAEATHHWSAQDYQSANMVPFVGKAPRGGGNIHVATGYNKWGMTNAVAAALTLSAEILGGSIPWAQTLSHRVTGPTDLATGAKFNAAVAGKLAKGWLGTMFTDEDKPLTEPNDAKSTQDGPTQHPSSPTRAGEDVPGEGEGRMLRRGVRPVAVSTVAGQTCRVSGMCTHLGGVLSWNDAEKSWDCPLHGSRFTAAGTVLEGPATADLETVDAGAAPPSGPATGPDN